MFSEGSGNKNLINSNKLGRTSSFAVAEKKLYHIVPINLLQTKTIFLKWKMTKKTGSMVGVYGRNLRSIAF